MKRKKTMKYKLAEISYKNPKLEKKNKSYRKIFSRSEKDYQ